MAAEKFNDLYALKLQTSMKTNWAVRAAEFDMTMADYVRCCVEFGDAHLELLRAQDRAASGEGVHGRHNTISRNPVSTI